MFLEALSLGQRLETIMNNNEHIEDKYPDIKYGIKFGYKNIGFNGKLYTFPYFLAFLLKRFIAERKDA